MTVPLSAALHGLGAVVAVAAATWIASMVKRDVSIVDSAWSLLILLAAIVYALELMPIGPRGLVALAITGAWSLRLCAHITVRNWGKPEDHRYREIRERNEPHFQWKSLYLVFGLQGVLAWIVAMPLLASLNASPALSSVDMVGIAMALSGVLIEAAADWQLTRFIADPANQGRVMDRGLWRFSRHPNYFGEFCVWWGLYMLALPAGGGWTIVSPVLMTVLLLRVSGVSLLEKSIGERRPAYRDYVARTNAFFPGLPRNERTSEG
jgi:steroid 5-alpha reductase family enzyme